MAWISFKILRRALHGFEKHCFSKEVFFFRLCEASNHKMKSAGLARANRHFVYFLLVAHILRVKRERQPSVYVKKTKGECL